MLGRSPDAWIIFTEEFRGHLRSRWYLFFTLLVVVLLIVAVLVVPLFQDGGEPSTGSGGQTALERIGFVDESGVFSGQEAQDGAGAATSGNAAEASGPTRYQERSEGLAALSRGEIDSLYVIPENYLESGRVEQYAEFEGRFPSNQEAEAALRAWLVKGLIAGRVDPGVEARVLDPAQFEDFRAEADGSVAELPSTAVQVGGLLLPMLFAGLLGLGLTIGSGYMVQNVSGEKESRLAEVVITSASSLSVMFGKLLALVGIGLGQAAVWIIVAAFTIPAMLESIAGGGDFTVSAGLWVTILACFVTGYFLTTTMAILLGAVAPSNREATRLGGWIPILSFIPFWFSGLILAQPDGAMATVLFYVPFTAPTAVLIRIGAGGDVGAPEISLALLGVAVTAAVLLWVAGRVYRAALLMRGQGVTLHNLWEALRTSQ